MNVKYSLNKAKLEGYDDYNDLIDVDGHKLNYAIADIEIQFGYCRYRNLDKVEIDDCSRCQIKEDFDMN